MKKVFSFFFPREIDFFTPMGRMFGLIGEGTRAYLAATGKDALTAVEKEKLLAELKRLEVAGDDVVREVTADLKRTFTPPFSQVELRRMFEKLDNTLDLLDESAKIVIHSGYRDGFPAFVRDQLGVFGRGLEEAARSVDLLKDPRRNALLLTSIVASVSAIETEGDKIYWPRKKEFSAAINSAAADNRLADYRKAVMDERVLDLMEELIDTLMDIMKVVEGMVIEHA